MGPFFLGGAPGGTDSVASLPYPSGGRSLRSPWIEIPTAWFVARNTNQLVQQITIVAPKASH